MSHRDRYCCDSRRFEFSIVPYLPLKSRRRKKIMTHRDCRSRRSYFAFSIFACLPLSFEFNQALQELVDSDRLIGYMSKCEPDMCYVTRHYAAHRTPPHTTPAALCTTYCYIQQILLFRYEIMLVKYVNLPLCMKFVLHKKKLCHSN
jgi:hypothetical protein